MRILLVLTCCVGLALFAGAAQPEDPGNHHGKKKGDEGNAPTQQVTTQQTGKKFKAGPGGGPHTQNFQQQSTLNYKTTGKNKWQGPVTGGNPGGVSGNNKFNKSLTVNKNITVNKNYKIQKFNLSNKPSGKYQTVKFSQNYK